MYIVNNNRICYFFVIINSPNYIIKNGQFSSSIDVFYTKYEGTKKENKAIEILTNRLNTLESWEKSDVYNKATYLFNLEDDENFTKLSEFVIDKYDENNEDLKKWYSFFTEIKRICSEATSLKDIYIDPQNYYGKYVIIGGFIGENDIKRKMLKIGRSYCFSNYISSDEFPLELYYGNISYKKWIDALDAVDNSVIAYGVLKKYSNSNDVYLDVIQLDFIKDAQLSTYSVISVDEQKGEKVVTKEQLYVFVNGVMNNVRSMKSFTDYVIEKWTNAISTKRDINQEIEAAYTTKSSELSQITLIYSAHILEYSKMVNVPQELQQLFGKVKLLENLYADFYKNKIENPNGSLITYSRDVGNILSEIENIYSEIIVLLN